MADDIVLEEGVPAWLETPATEIPATPPTVTRPQLLPLHDLTWENFERLCTRCVRSRGEVVRTQQYGVKGQGQQGIDFYARLADPLRYEVFQCKKLKNFTPRDVERAVGKFVKGNWYDRSSAFRILTSHAIEDSKVAEAIEVAGKQLEAKNIGFEVLGVEQISAWLKTEPRLVDDFFSRPWVEAFCGTEALDRLGKRLNANDVVKYRQALKKFYSVLFNRQDTGIPVGPRIGDDEIPLRDRFVVPEVFGTLGNNVGSLETASREETAEDSRFQSPETDNRPLSPQGLVEEIRVRSAVDRWITQRQRSVILGGPGSGKSALLRMLALELLSEDPIFRETAVRWGGLLPVWIPFSFWTNLNTKGTVPASLSECLAAWFKQFDQGKVWSLVENAIEDDRLLLLVDGLDEWTDETAARTTSQLLQTFIQTRNLSAVLVSRPYGFERVAIQGSDWQVGQLAPLSADQKKRLIGTWLSIHRRRNEGQSGNTAEPPDAYAAELYKEADDFIRKLTRSNDLAQLSETPLTLLLLLYLHLQNYPLPANRFEAYEHVTNHFIREHPLSRRTAAMLTAEQGVLDQEEIRDVLAYIAYVIQTEFPAGILSADDVRSHLQKFLQDDSEQGLGLTRTESRDVLHSFTNVEEGSLGLLVSQGQSRLSFFHRSLQEYLAAVHLARKSSRNKKRQFEIGLPIPAGER